MINAHSTAGFPLTLSEIGVIGAGTMGQGIAQIAAQAGFNVLIYDAGEGKARAAIEAIKAILTKQSAKGKITPHDLGATLARLRPAQDLNDFSAVQLVFEAIIEDLDSKRGLFRQLESIVGDDCLLATNTSSLLVTAIAASCRRPERVAGAHFFNPVPLMKVVEIIRGAKTADATADTLAAVVRRFGHTPVAAADTPGFLINHAGRGLYTEGIRILSEGIAAAADVDRVMCEAAGFRLGPFQLFDLTGLDVSYPVLLQIYRAFFEEARFRPAPLLQTQVAAGLYGRKVGQGFYRYEDGAAVIAPEPTPQDFEIRPVWMSRTDRAAHPWAAERLAECGIELSPDENAPPDAILLTLPIGYDATTAATDRSLDPERVMALDPLLHQAARLTIMPTSVTLPAYRDSLHGMLAAASPVTLIHDSPGFIAQRVLAMIVNIAADIAQQRIALPHDIDIAVRIGLGYPDGPLALGDRIGAPVVLTILERLQAFYGDPRYRPSPWLKRRAMTGCSLLHPES